jgi:hypothetical protein
MRKRAVRFTEIDSFGVYVAPMSIMMVAAWVVRITWRRGTARFGLMYCVWHPALLIFVRGINVSNAQPNGERLAQVNAIFTWVSLAQRIPVRIRIDHVPEGAVLVAGATVQIDPWLARPRK